MTASFTSISHANLRRVLNGTSKTPTDDLLIIAAQVTLHDRSQYDQHAIQHPLGTEPATPSTILTNLLAR